MHTLSTIPRIPGQNGKEIDKSLTFIIISVSIVWNIYIWMQGREEPQEPVKEENKEESKHY